MPTIDLPLPYEILLLRGAHALIWLGRTAVQTTDPRGPRLDVYRTTSPVYGRWNRYLDASRLVLAELDRDWIAEFEGGARVYGLSGANVAVDFFVKGRSAQHVELVREIQRHLTHTDPVVRELTEGADLLVNAAHALIRSEADSPAGVVENTQRWYSLAAPAIRDQGPFTSWAASYDWLMAQVEVRLYDRTVVPLADAANRARLDPAVLRGLVKAGHLATTGTPRKPEVLLGDVARALNVERLRPPTNVVRPAGEIVTPLGTMRIYDGIDPDAPAACHMDGYAEIDPSDVLRRNLLSGASSADLRGTLDTEPQVQFWIRAFSLARWGREPMYVAWQSLVGRPPFGEPGYALIVGHIEVLDPNTDPNG